MHPKFDGRRSLCAYMIRVACLTAAVVLAQAPVVAAQVEKFDMPKGELARINGAAALVAAATQCSLDTKPFFQKFMEVEKKLYSFEQVAFIGNYLGTVVGQKLSEPSHKSNCDSIARELRTALGKLSATKFGAKPSAKTDLFWFDLGSNGGVKRAVIYPIGEPDHSVLIIFFVDGIVNDFNIERVPEKIDNEDFDKAKWAKTTGAGRFPMAVSLVNSEIILGKTKDEVIKLLGQPDGTMVHEYGYEIIK